MHGRPPKHRCIVKMDAEEITAGGIILPNSLSKSNRGVIVQSGIEMVSEGLEIALDENATQEIILPEGKFISAHEDTILMIKQNQ